METVQGQLTSRRAVSKRIVFYDLLGTRGSSDAEATNLSDAHGQGQQQQEWVEVVVKQDVFGSVQDVKDLRDRLKLGDTIAVRGMRESGHVLSRLLAEQVDVMQTWRDTQPGVTFKPQPSPHHQQQQAHAELQQQPPQQPEQPQQQLAVVEAQQGAQPADHPTEAEAVVRRPQLTLCKFWVNTGRCTRGALCPHAHLQSGVLQRGWVNQMRNERQLLSSFQGFSHSGSAAAKGRRAQVFARWLVETFGREALSAGAGVLDVAGGAGSVTFELSVVHGVRCTLVDPRPLKFNRQQHRQLQQAGLAAVLHTLTQQQLEQGCMPAEAPRPHQQPRLGVPTHPSPAAAPSSSPSSAPAAAVPSTSSPPPPPSGAAGGSGPQPRAVHLRQVQALFGPPLWQSSGWQRLLGGGGCSLVVGLHPDEATDSILDYALRVGCSFAIVPCCVFARLFPHRQLAGEGGAAQPVTTYPQLVEYLTTKGQAQQQVLEFEGANTVVYRTPP